MVAAGVPLFAGVMRVLPVVRRGGERFTIVSKHIAKLTDHPHVLALLPQARGVHLDQLLDEDTRARVGLVLKAIGVRDRGANEIIHELELAANRHR